MANTFSQIYLHVVFSTLGREYTISEKWETQLYKYITGIVDNNGVKLFAINGMPDHIHLLLSINPDTSISNLVRDIKSSSTKFINEGKLVVGKFQWQKGYSVFSVSNSQKDKVYKYVLNQKEHHKTSSFKDEYLALLKLNGVEFDEKYVLG
jgi:putative transposase